MAPSRKSAADFFADEEEDEVSDASATMMPPPPPKRVKAEPPAAPEAPAEEAAAPPPAAPRSDADVMPPPPARATATSLSFVKGEDLACVPTEAAGLTRPLPRDWRAVPSKSRPGETSYVHVPTGLKQARFPESDPSPVQIAEHNEAVRRAKAKKGSRGKAPLLKHAPTANWQAFSQKKRPR